jgi:hypothetical protein
MGGLKNMTLAQQISDAGIAIDFKFVPASTFENDPWRSQALNWMCIVRVGDRVVLGTTYSQGKAHTPANKKDWGGDHTYKEKAMDLEIETGLIAMSSQDKGPILSHIPVPPPSVADVMASLCMDSDVMNYSSFEDWASNLGYDTDSIKARDIYNLTLANSLRLNAAFGAGQISVWRDMAG